VYLFQSPAVDPDSDARLVFPAVDVRQKKYDGGKEFGNVRVQVWAGVLFFGLLMPSVVAWILFSRHFLSFAERLFSALLFVALMSVISLASDGQTRPRRIFWWSAAWTGVAAAWASALLPLQAVALVLVPVVTISYYCLWWEGQ
jgi:hypothetical protein